MIINGEIYDQKTGNLILNGTINKVDSSGNVVQTIAIKDGSFAINISTQPDATVYYYFSSPGYNFYYANEIALANSEAGAYNIPLNSLTAEPPASVTASDLTLPIAAGALLLFATKNKKKHVGKLEVKDVTPYLLIGGVLIALGGANKLLQSLGLETNSAVEAIKTDPGSFWNPSFYTNYSNYTKAITTAQAQQYAETLYNAVGFFSSDIASITAVIHSLQTQSELSFIAKIFNDEYSQDLLTYLTGFSWTHTPLSNDQILTLNEYVGNLPTN